MASIRKVADARYKVLWREPIRDDFGVPTGKFRQTSETITAQTDSAAMKVAQSRAREIEAALATRTIDPTVARDKANTPLGQYANRYLDSLAGQIAQRTIDGYAALYRVHIGPAFGSRPIGSILPSDVQTWHATLLATSPTRKESTRNPKTAKQALGVLRRIFNHAALDSAVTSNPAAIKLNSTHKRRTNGFRHQPLSPNQIANLANYIATEQRSPVYALAITFAAYTGVRAAELAGLQVGDLTLSDLPGTAGQIRVERTKTRIGGGFRTDTPKTAESLRTVPLESWLADDVRDYLSRTHPNASDPTAPLFPGRFSMRAAQQQGRNTRDSADRFSWAEPIDPSNVYKRYMQPALAAINLPAARFHDLRHSFAVNLLSANPPVDFKRVSKWLGHSTFTLTLDTYGDYINEDVALPAGLARPVAAQSDTANVVPLERKAN